MSEICETCKYWKPYDNSRWEGTCRINPPKKNSLRLGPGEWPNTRYDDFCGKHIYKEQEEKTPQPNNTKSTR